jgi:hypothetical protein
LAVTPCSVEDTEQKDLFGVMFDFIEGVQGEVGDMRFAVRTPVGL